MSRMRILAVIVAVALTILPAAGSWAQSPDKAASSSQAPPQGTVDKAYVIGPEDVLEIQVWERNDLNQTVFVRPDGRTSLPLVGEIMVAGKTVQELQDHLAEVYEKTVKGAVVTVIVRDIKSRPVYFVGGFGRTGPLQLMRDMTLIQAISMVGGVAPGADAEHGYLLRGERRIPIDFLKLVQKGDLTQNYKLEPGDSVIAPLADLVYVQGEVRSPGAVKYTNDLTLLKAITQVGGLTPLAAAGRVELLRGKGEKRERMKVDVDNIIRAPQENADVSLKPDDIIFVPQRLF
jgi:polysaccharide export outer membrane protein